MTLAAVGYEYCCNECGEGFNEPAYEQEDRGEFWGMPAYETMAYCPHCGSADFEEADQDYEEET